MWHYICIYINILRDLIKTLVAMANRINPEILKPQARKGYGLVSAVPTFVVVASCSPFIHSTSRPCTRTSTVAGSIHVDLLLLALLLLCLLLLRRRLRPEQDAVCASGVVVIQ